MQCGDCVGLRTCMWRWLVLSVLTGVGLCTCVLTVGMCTCIWRWLVYTHMHLIWDVYVICMYMQITYYILHIILGSETYVSLCVFVCVSVTYLTDT